MITSPFQEEITATLEPYALALVWGRFQRQRQDNAWGSEEKWGDRSERIAYHAFFLAADLRILGQDYRSIAKMLSCSEDEARAALNFLERSQLITMKVHRKERPMEEQGNTLDTILLGQSFNELKKDSDAIVRKFYQVFFQKGRDILFSNEIEELFGEVEDMDHLYIAFWGSLASIMNGVLNGANVAGYLQHLGRNHSLKYHVKPGYYGIAGQALIETFQWYYAYRGLVWTQELQNAWVAAYTLVSSLMITDVNTGPL